MVKIITDSASLYTAEEANAKGFRAIPLCISIDDWDKRDLQMDMDQFYNKIAEESVPKSSQPPIGEVLEVYEEFLTDEIINITIADGLSGTYQTACAAKQMSEHVDNITVFNSRTLCGPLQYMVKQANDMAQAGASKEEILNWLEVHRETAHSFLIPQDLEFLKRGGRLTPVAAKIGSLLKLKPTLKQTDDGKRLDKFAIKRTLSATVESIVRNLQHASIHLDESYCVYVSHARVEKDASKVVELLKKTFPKIQVTVLELSPAFVTQGGPGCIAIQYIKK